MSENKVTVKIIINSLLFILLGILIGVASSFILMKNININLIKIISQNTSLISNIATILIGVILGYLIKKYESDELRTIINNSLVFMTKDITNVVLIITSAIALLFTIQSIGGKIDDSIISAMSNFYVSFVFAWLLTQKSTTAGFEKELKTKAAMAYNQLSKLEEHIDYSLVTIKETLDEASAPCKNNTAEKCSEKQLSNQKLMRISDLLQDIKHNVESNKMNWTILINKDIDNLYGYHNSSNKAGDSSGKNKQNTQNIDEKLKNKFGT